MLSQIFRVLSSEAETSRLESEDQETSEMPWKRRAKDEKKIQTGTRTRTRTRTLTSLWPTMDFSNFPSYAPQIFISLSAAKTKQKNPKTLSCSEDAFKDSEFSCRSRLGFLTGAGQPLSVGAEFD